MSHHESNVSRLAIYTEIAGENFTKAEVELLNATKASEHAQTLFALRKHANYMEIGRASRAMNRLITKGVLKPMENWDGTDVFGFGESDFAQAVYCEIYQVPPVEV